MAKGPKNEYVWMECTECGTKNYRTPVSTQPPQGGQQPKKLARQKVCKNERKHTVHKMRKK